MGLITLGIGSTDHLSPADLGGLRVAGDFCSCAVMHVHSGMTGCWRIISAANSWFSMSTLVLLALVGGFPVVGGSRAEYRFLCGGTVFATVH